MPLDIQVNGAPRQVPDGTTVGDLVRGEGWSPNQVAVELNQELVPRAARDAQVLQAGDAVELVTLVGGG